MADFKTLLVMRHAKSSWAISGIPDHERPLNRRGERDAIQMAKFLQSKQMSIDRLAASTATRAMKTAEALVETMDGPDQSFVEFRDEFYLAAPRTYLQYLANVEDNISTVMVIGHNPGLESLVHSLGGQWEAMPTAAIACFELTASSWQDLTPETFRLDHLWRPKEVLAHYR